MKYLPYPYDKPNIEFSIRFKNYGTSTNLNDLTSTRISIQILKSQPAIRNFAFSVPEIPNKFIVVHLNDNFRFNQIIYQFETYKTSIQSNIAYKLLNTELYMFRIEGDLLRIIYPFSSLDDFRRDNYLVKIFYSTFNCFIES